MKTAPQVIVFDVNETLSDMAPMGSRFADNVGAPAALAKLWFATLLRDGFALTASGDNGSFAAIGAEALRGLLAGAELDRGLDAAVEHIMDGLAGLSLHPDVPEGIRSRQRPGSACAREQRLRRDRRETVRRGGPPGRFRAAAHGRGRPRVETGPGRLRVCRHGYRN